MSIYTNELSTGTFEELPRVWNKRQKGIPNEAIYVGRPTEWGNPYVIGKDGDRLTVVDKYKRWITSRGNLVQKCKEELRGKDLICWCAPEACHADVLLEIANS